jgi:Fe2+ or Zn2+ uptake regulation protein
MVNDEQHSDSHGPLEAVGGLRMTRQRREVFRVLNRDLDHPTANDVFMKVKEGLPAVSLATVYNCLEALVQHRLVRQVNFERGPSRYCPNLTEHGHFHDMASNTIHDVVFKPGVELSDFIILPEGAIIDNFEITLRGKLPGA